MKTLNQLIRNYTSDVQRGEIQIAYKSILRFMGKLRAHFIDEHPHYEASNIYQGYMDMSYFSLSSKGLRDKGLKFAVVYLHEKGCFEVWLSARNKKIAKQYHSEFSSKSFAVIAVFHDENNEDAILEHTLSSVPDFENEDVLKDTIVRGVEKFIETVSIQVHDKTMLEG